MVLKVFYKKIYSPLYFGLINSWQFKDPRVLFSCVMTRRLPKSTKIPHPIGIVIGKSNGVSLGENCTIMQNVTIGVRKLGDKKGPKIGDNVFLGASSVIVGDISIGDNVSIGAGCYVDFDVPDNFRVRGYKANLIQGE